MIAQYALLWALLFSSVICDESKRVLLISFDGFRYDLMNSSFTPFIAEWAEKGAWFVNGVASQYVTYTAPNHLSIITGLREESHGIVSNYFYDPESKEYFDIFNMTHKEGVVNSSLAEHWFFGEPIWLTNQKAGGRSSVLYWPAGDAVWPPEPRRPTWHKAWTDYGDLPSWMKDVDDLVERLETDPSTNFAAWYVAQPDHVLHLYGFFFEDRLKNELHALDELFQYLIKRLESRGLLDSTDIILTADHGHAEIGGPKHVMCIPDFVSGKVGVDFEIGDHMIYPADEERAIAIHKNLTEATLIYGYKVNIYFKKDLPPRFHYQKTPRVGAIVFEPEIGYATSFDCTKKKLQEQYGPELRRDMFHSSTHGMDPVHEEMRALLVMNGPSFVRGQKFTDVPENIDLYGMMSHLLGAKAAPNNGSMQIVGRALRSSAATDKPYSDPVVIDMKAFVFFVLPSMIIVGLFLTYAWKRTVVMEKVNRGVDKQMGYDRTKIYCRP